MKNARKVEEPAGKGVLIFIYAITVLLFMDTNSRGINFESTRETSTRPRTGARARDRAARLTDSKIGIPKLQNANASGDTVRTVALGPRLRGGRGTPALAHLTAHTCPLSALAAPNDQTALPCTSPSPAPPNFNVTSL